MHTGALGARCAGGCRAGPEGTGAPNEKAAASTPLRGQAQRIGRLHTQVRQQSLQACHQAAIESSTATHSKQNAIF
jgi:hypothetical protein